ncbi:MAG TPA: TRAP transporter small permease [Burkholderiaceae bacterium]|nr:TRAP transporter small permease [Burkholderiaceae bacterium]
MTAAAVVQPLPVRWLDAALRGLRPAARVAAIAGGALLLAAAVLVSFDVLARKFLNWSLGGADELSGYAFAIGTAWSFAFVVLERGNVRVDALYLRLPASARSWLDLAALAALATFAGLIVRWGGDVMARSVALAARSNSALAVPLAIPQSVWWAGYALFLATLIVLFARVALALAAGDHAAVARLAGARSATDDAQHEIELAHARAAEQVQPDSRTQLR